MQYLGKILGIIAIGLMPYASQAYVITYAKFQGKTDHGNKEIILLGDFHILMPEDKQHYNILKNAIKKWSEESQKTLFLIEGVQKDHEKFSQANGLVKFGHLLKRTIIDDDVSMKKLRIDISLGKFNDYAPHAIMELADQRVPGASKLFMLDLNGLLRYDPITFAKFITEIKYSINQLDRFLQQYPQFQSVIGQYKQKYTDGLQGIQDLVNKFAFDQNVPICSVLNPVQEKIYKKNNTITGFGGGSPKDYLLQPYTELFVSDMADCGFLMRILEEYNKYDRVVLYAGAAHTERIKGLLQQCFGNQFNISVDLGKIPTVDAVDLSILLSPSLPMNNQPNNKNHQQQLNKLSSWLGLKIAGAIGIAGAVITFAVTTAYILWQKHKKTKAIKNHKQAFQETIKLAQDAQSQLISADDFTKHIQRLKPKFIISQSQQKQLLGYASAHAYADLIAYIQKNIVINL